MLKLALSFELRSLVRNPAAMVALLAYLATGVFAIATGAGHVEEWESTITTARDAQEASVAEARGLFANGRTGPADRAWVSLASPRWQAEYAGTRVIREPGPLAGIAAGSVDPAPVAFHLQTRGDPFAVAGHRIENPEVASGSVDLVFVLSMLTPLLLGVLGLGIGTREREEGIDRIVVVQAGEVRPWLVARVGAVTVVASTAAGGLCIGACLVGGASFGEAGVFTGLAIVYTILWSGLLLAATATARTVRVGAFAFGALWTLLCVLLPAVVAEVGFGRVGQDFAVEETVEVRAQQWSAYDEHESVRLRGLYRHFPELERLPAASDAPLPRALRRHTFMGGHLDRIDERHAARLTQEHAAQQFAEGAAWLSPPVALTLALERVAGVGPEAASAYRGEVIEALRERIRWVLVQSWTKEPLDQADFDGLVASSPSAYRWEARGLTGPAAALLVWLFLGWLGATRRLAR